MNESFLVVNVHPQGLEELRRVVGNGHGLVDCESLDSLRAELSTAPQRPAILRVNCGALRALADDQPAEATQTHPCHPTVDGHGAAHHHGNSNGHGNGHSTTEPLGNGAARRPTLASQVDEAECKIIEESLRRNRHHRQETAAELGISRVTLYNKMKKFGLLD
jgi:DNA-binding NtrC family response regulator